jgi:hypothetical protein
MKLIDELNDNYSRGNAYAAHALLRAILDDMPLLPGCADFKAAASSYPWGRTDRGYARRLLAFKLQADDALHRQISKRAGHLGIDDMPPKVWVNTILQECAETKMTTRARRLRSPPSQHAPETTARRAQHLRNSPLAAQTASSRQERTHLSSTAQDRTRGPRDRP